MTTRRTFIKALTGAAAGGATITATEISAVATLTEEFKMRLITSFGVHDGITVAVPDMLALSTKEPISDIDGWMVALKETKPHFFSQGDRKLVRSVVVGELRRETFSDKHGMVERLQVGNIVQEKRL